MNTHAGDFVAPSPGHQHTRAAVVRGGSALDENTVRSIAGDDGRRTDHVVRRLHDVDAVAQCAQAIGGRPDAYAVDDIAFRTVDDVDAIAVIVGSDAAHGVEMRIV